jgi:hypothetical protein
MTRNVAWSTSSTMQEGGIHPLVLEQLDLCESPCPMENGKPSQTKSALADVIMEVDGYKDKQKLILKTKQQLFGMHFIVFGLHQVQTQSCSCSG